MELYEKVSYQVSELVTEQYSTSFSMSSRLFDDSIRADIYAVYGLVRIADEIVDTYRNDDAKELLTRLEVDTYAAIARGYDTNPIVHSFALTAKRYGIDEVLIRPFFESMAMDLETVDSYTVERYETYIYGSAEVVGLMCLRVFCGGDEAQYRSLVPGARALGSAYQKVNFLRDVAADHDELGRLYFPGVTYGHFDEAQKARIVEDIGQDFAQARSYVSKLPSNSRRAVSLSMLYYGELLQKIKATSAETLKQERVRIGGARKLWLLTKVTLGVVK
ncbi:phytoene/squalene synthase family protein [Candidatus Saccharibacteria bacterium]|nr:phytoene/squalene synthase family protein [Candidatus Saccharibacteria bacterium]